MKNPTGNYPEKELDDIIGIWNDEVQGEYTITFQTEEPD